MALLVQVSSSQSAKHLAPEVVNPRPAVSRHPTPDPRWRFLQLGLGDVFL